MTDNLMQNWAKDLNTPSRRTKKREKKRREMANIYLKDNQINSLGNV